LGCASREAGRESPSPARDLDIQKFGRFARLLTGGSHPAHELAGVTFRSDRLHAFGVIS
jgi:hypothetical protein